MAKRNLIPNGDFQLGKAGTLPEGWTTTAYRPDLMPEFKLARKDGSQMLLAQGTGNPDCVGYVAAKVPVTLGKTYLFRALFRMSADANPSQNVLFQCFGPGANDGILEFRRLDDGWVEGSAKIAYSGAGPGEAEARVLFRLSAKGKLWVKELSLSETTPVQPRWLRVACTNGATNLATCEAVLDAAAESGADLVLLPEYMQGERIEEPLRGDSYKLMSAKAKQYGMHVAGGIVRKADEGGLVYNTALLLDRKGKLVGTYDKVHPYSPEVNFEGISVGRSVPVFRSDFGKGIGTVCLGVMICYDSWFTDVAELLALKGAELILFPNAGYYRALMRARAADNNVRIMTSSWGSGYGVWDTVGRDLTDLQSDCTHGEPPGCTHKDVTKTMVGEIGLLMASLDLNCSPSPHWNGGTMWEAPGNRRVRRDQAYFLEEAIKAERERWWVE